MSLSFTKKSYFVTKLIDFPKIRNNNVEYFDLLHAQKPKLGLVFFKSFSICNYTRKLNAILRNYLYEETMALKCLDSITEGFLVFDFLQQGSGRAIPLCNFKNAKLTNQHFRSKVYEKIQ